MCVCVPMCLFLVSHLTAFVSAGMSFIANATRSSRSSTQAPVMIKSSFGLRLPLRPVLQHRPLFLVMHGVTMRRRRRLKDCASVIEACRKTGPKTTLWLKLYIYSFVGVVRLFAPEALNDQGSVGMRCTGKESVVC